MSALIDVNRIVHHLEDCEIDGTQRFYEPSQTRQLRSTCRSALHRAAQKIFHTSRQYIFSEGNCSDRAPVEDATFS